MSASEEKTLYQINFYEGTVDLQIILFSKKYHNVKNYSVTPKVSIMQKSYCYMYVIVILSKKVIRCFEVLSVREKVYNNVKYK